MQHYCYSCINARPTVWNSISYHCKCAELVRTFWRTELFNAAYQWTTHTA